MIITGYQDETAPMRVSIRYSPKIELYFQGAYTGRLNEVPIEVIDVPNTKFTFTMKPCQLNGVYNLIGGEDGIIHAYLHFIMEHITNYHVEGESDEILYDDERWYTLLVPTRWRVFIPDPTGRIYKLYKALREDEQSS